MKCELNSSEMALNIQRIILAGFQMIEERVDGFAFRHVLARDLSVIVSVSRENDGKRWKHVSFARAKRMPTIDEINEYKAIFIGEDAYGLMVLPPKDRHVNIHKYCLHLWQCLDDYPLPEFSGFIGNARSL